MTVAWFPGLFSFTATRIMTDFCCCCCCSCRNEANGGGNDHETAKHGDKAKYQPLEDIESSTSINVIDIVLPKYEKIPVEKIFEFQQPDWPVYVHPQLDIIFADDAGDVSITHQQPSFFSRPEDNDVTKMLAKEPSIRFALYYDFQRQVLSVHLHSALCLFGGSGKKQSKCEADSIIMLFLVPHKEHVFYSAVVKNTNNPSFDEMFEFIGFSPNEIRRQFLVFRIFDKNKPTTRNELGTVILPLENADLYGVSIRKSIKSMADQEDTDILNQFDSNGDVLVSLMHDPSVSIISGVLLKARNLQKMDIGGLSDPYVKIYLLHKGERISKWKSTIKKKTLTPIYNEPFQFDVAGMDVDLMQLQLTLFDHDVLGSDDVMGAVEFGTNSNHHTGRLHWIEMTSSPRNQVCFWHSMDKT